MNKQVKVNEGDVIEFVAMEWREDEWEFDFPSVLLEPVVRWYESGCSCDEVIENAVIDASVDGVLTSEEIPDFRGTLRGLKRIRTMVENGREFQKEYKVVRETYRFQKDGNGELEGVLMEDKC